MELCNNKHDNAEESQTHYQKIIWKNSTEPGQTEQIWGREQGENPNELERRQTNTCPAMSVKYYNSTYADWLW